MMQNLLEQITVRLQQDAKNYSVFLKVHEVPYVPPPDPEELIRASFGAEAKLGSIDEIEGVSVCPELDEALFYPGDEGAGPGNTVLKKNESFIELIEDFKGEIRRLAGASRKIQRFWLKDGHPAYPVFFGSLHICFGRTIR